MKLKDIAPGTKFEIEAYDKNGEKYDFPLISQLEWVENDEKAIIYAPIKEGVVFPLRIGSVINVYFSVKIAENDYHLYKFSATVLARKVREGIAMLLLSIEGALVRVQRRNYFRFFHMMPVKYRWIVDKKQEIEEETENQYKNSYTRDISGEGICILTEEKPNYGDEVECKLELEPGIETLYNGKIVRVSKCNNEGKFNYENGVSFLNITEKERQKIIKFIFDTQRKLRKKGLI